MRVPNYSIARRSNSMTIYLYVKQHNLTGLKYLGKTTNSDPHAYPGSGIRWRKHLNKHGYNYTTTVLRECQDTEELKFWGRYYSELWDVAESDAWANLKTEEGQGGELSEESRALISRKKKGIPKTSEHKEKISVTKKGQKYGPQSEEHKRNNSESKMGRPQPKDAIARRTASRKGGKWYNNGIISKFSQNCPDGFVPGRAPGSTKARPSDFKWFTNGITNVMSNKCPAGFVPGMTRNLG
jgi:hypothetical protein